MTRILTKQFFKLQRENTDFVKSIVHLWVKYISFMMFFMMPIFAFFLWLIFVKRTKNYYEYLIFSVHYHTFCYFVFIIVLGINYFYWNSWLSLLTFALPFLILYKSLRKIYDISRFRAVLYSVSLNLSYSLILFTGILISLIIGALNA